MIENLEKTIKSLGYDVQKNENAYNELLVGLDFDDEVPFDKQKHLSLIVHFDEELDGSVLIQFFYQFEFDLNILALQNTYKTLAKINLNLPIGHFNVLEDYKKLYFKYVFIQNKEDKPKPEMISDILDMCIYSIETYGKEFN